MRQVKQRGAVVVLVFFLSLFAGPVSRAEVLVVISDSTEEYRSIAQEIIRATPLGTGVITLYSDLVAEQEAKELIVTVGRRANKAVTLDDRFSHIPVLSTFLPRPEFRPGPQRSAVFNDINPLIHVRLVKELFPERSPRIGLFVDSETKYLFKSEAVDRIGGFYLVQKVLTEGENPARVIDSFVAENNLDAFIVIPSSIIYDPHSLNATLYSLYKRNIPAIAYTPKLVEGGVGCVVAAYFDKQIVMSEVTRKINLFYETGELSTATSIPKTAKVSVNPRLAGTLQLDLSNLMKYGEMHE